MSPRSSGLRLLAGDNGWFIVPSAANEYGQAYAAADDGFAWDVAAGEFTVDFFFV